MKHLCITLLLGLGGFVLASAEARAATCKIPFQDVAVTQAVQPDYPESARELGLGPVVVKVKVTVGPSGSLIDASIFESSGNLSLDQAALSAARQSTYSPKVANCEPVVGDFIFVVPFDAGGGSPTPAPAPTPFVYANGPLGECQKLYVGNKDPSITNLDSAESDFFLARCLSGRNHFKQARDILLHLLSETNDFASSKISEADLYWELAVTEEHLGLKQDSIKHILSAHDYRSSEKHKHEINLDYNRINRVAIARELAEQQRQAASERAAARAAKARDVASSRHDWDAMSYDERRVISQYGGTRDSNNSTPLCHVEVFDSANNHVETWWFCNSSGDYEKAYTFTNGVLTSTFQP